MNDAGRWSLIRKSNIESNNPDVDVENIVPALLKRHCMICYTAVQAELLLVDITIQEQAASIGRVRFDDVTGLNGVRQATD